LTCFDPCRTQVCFRGLDPPKLKTATPTTSNGFVRERALLLFFCVLLSGCSSRHGVSGPSIEFTTIPPAAEGGPDKVDSIEGRVRNARPGQQIVLYARWGPWWVQPLADQPYTRIQPDSKWRSSTHFGTEYAALLVDPGYRPLATMEALPGEGAGVIVVATTKGRPAYWQTWWFLLSIWGAFALAVVSIFRARMHRMTQQLSVRLEERLAERARIARELHDTLLQSFHGLLLRFQAATNLLPDRPEEARKALESAIDQAALAITEGRDAVQGLRSSTTVTNDLARAISTLGEELATSESNPNSAAFHVEVEGTSRNFHAILRDEVYRIAAEAVRNAFSHAQAQRIEVEIRYDERQFRLRVRDDGQGIDPKFLKEGGQPGHYGLRGMRERAKLLGGKLAVWTERDSGTELEFSIPASRAYEASNAPHRSWLAEKFSWKETELKS
jgi:signal transduction histidine kinase